MELPWQKLAIKDYRAEGGVGGKSHFGCLVCELGSKFSLAPDKVFWTT